MSKRIDLSDVAFVLREALKFGEVNFVFIKKDGSKRVANGTLNLSLIPEEDKQFVKPEEERVERDDQITYYDLDKKGWRVVKIANVLEINGGEVVG